MFKKAAGLRITQIPYQGDAQSLTALIAGQVQLQFAVPLTVLPHIASGKLKAIAAAARQRSSVLPNVPTFAEQGFPGIEAETWFSVLAPAGTPTPVVERLNHEINKILDAPDVRTRLRQLGAVPGGGSLSEIDAFMRAEYPKWAQRVKDSDATAN
jgi:tripartite-type tricarboxylate transporter receptor subunit TctC